MRRLEAIGIDEIACLIDFGVAGDEVLSSLRYLGELRSQAQESYEPLPGPLLSAPLTVLRGRADRIVSRPETEAWSSATTAPCVLTEFDGAHMYLLEHRDALLRLVENQLAEDAGIGSGR